MRRPSPAIDKRRYATHQLILFMTAKFRPYTGLRLNADKSEVVLLAGTPAQLRSAANITTVDVAGSTLPVASKLKSLGVTIDSNLLFDCHARNVAKACNFHTRALRHMCSLLTDDVAQTVACSIVAFRLDYCNALLSGAPAATFDKLQRAQNNLAGVLCQRRRRTDARPLLHSLHWLPVRQHGSPIKWLYITNSQGADHIATSTYLSELVQTHAPPRSLRSPDAPTLVVPRTQYVDGIF